MSAVTARPLWQGRTAAIIGIVLLALNLRTAVAVLAPIISFVSDDIPLTSVGVGLLGMLAPLAFAASGFVAPLVARRVGLEFTVVLACAAMVVGPLVRAVAPSYAVLVLGSVITMAGMGFGNILLPPVVKRYFPDRIALLSAVYVTLLAVSSAVPALVAAPVAVSSGWRISIGMWAVFAVAALVPWLVVLGTHRRRPSTAVGDVPTAPPALVGRMHRSRVAIAIAITFSVSAFNVYALFAWLPEILIANAGSTPTEAGTLLALFGITGLPLGFIVPALVTRYRNVSGIIIVGVVLYAGGYLGLLLAPTFATWLWVLVVGWGAIVFPLCLVLINVRTRSPEASIALSGFAQGIGYAVGALGPLLLGLVHDLSGGWTAPLILLLVTVFLMLLSAGWLAKPRYVEDELELRKR